MRPIIIMANKSDTETTGASIIADPLISDLISSHSQIETCIQCSAKTMRNVPEVFYYAQKTVLYPTAPVYSEDHKALTSDCLRSLKRVFALCDRDNDGVLNDVELNAFQLTCFGVRLNSTSLQEVKALLRGTPNALSDNQVTLIGFIHLHELPQQRPLGGWQFLPAWTQLSLGILPAGGCPPVRQEVPR